MARAIQPGENRRRHDGYVVARAERDLYHVSRPGNRAWCEVGRTPDELYYVKLWYDDEAQAISYTKAFSTAEEVAVGVLNGDPGDRLWHPTEDALSWQRRALTNA